MSHSGGADVLWFSFMCIGIILVPAWVIGTIGATRYGIKLDDSAAPTSVRAAM